VNKYQTDVDTMSRGVRRHFAGTSCLCRARCVESVILWDFQYDHCEYFLSVNRIMQTSHRRVFFSISFDCMAEPWMANSGADRSIVAKRPMH